MPVFVLTARALNDFHGVDLIATEQQPSLGHIKVLHYSLTIRVVSSNEKSFVEDNVVNLVELVNRGLYWESREGQLYHLYVYCMYMTLLYKLYAGIGTTEIQPIKYL